MKELIRIKKFEWECIKKIGMEFNHLERGFFQGAKKEAEVVEELLQEHRLLAFASIDDLKIGNSYSFIIKSDSKVTYNVNGKAYVANQTRFSEISIDLEKITPKYLCGSNGSRMIKKDEIFGIIE